MYVHAFNLDDLLVLFMLLVLTMKHVLAGVVIIVDRKHLASDGKFPFLLLFTFICPLLDD